MLDERNAKNARPSTNFGARSTPGSNVVKTNVNDRKPGVRKTTEVGLQKK